MNFDIVMNRSLKNMPDSGLVKAQIMQADGIMFSLQDAFNNETFGLDTTSRTLNYIARFKKEYIEPLNSTLKIDSSGYSFIRGSVHRLDALKLIEC